MRRSFVRGASVVLDRALLEPEDARALGLTRIAIASVLAASALGHLGSVTEYFSDDSVIAGAFARQAFPTRWSAFFTWTSPAAVHALFAAGILAHACWILGLLTPLAGVASFAFWASLVGRHPLLYSLPDQLQMALCLWLALMPTGRAYSLDAALRRRFGGAKEPATVPVWCRRVIQLQLGVMYTATGLLKSGSTWKSGTAIYFALINPYNRHFDLATTLAALEPWLLRPMTWLVLVWEVGFIGFVATVWLREAGRWAKVPDLRIVFLGFGIAMHVGIQVFLYVAWFSPLCIFAYTAFLRPEETQALVRALRARLGRRRQPPVATALPVGDP